MKKYPIFLIAALTAALYLSGCGKEPSEEVSVDIEDITAEPEQIPENTEEDSAPQEDTYVDDEEAPGEGYVRSPLTNLWVKEEVAASRPIAVMMPTDSVAQPQYNIGNAGILYEIMEEGDISRQMAIIEGWQDMEKIGNIRSIRRYYIPLGLEWDSIIVHFGGPFYADELITSPGVDNITGAAVGNTKVSPGSGAFFRDSGKSAPHNAFTSGEKLTTQIEKLGYAKEHKSSFASDHFTFTTSSNPNTLEAYSNAKNAELIDLRDPFPYTGTQLKYSAEEGVYYKELLKDNQIDAATGEQLTFTNVIIQMAEWEQLDDNGYKDFDIVDSGKPGYFCTKGKMIPITWTKTGNKSPTKYYDMDGKEIVLNTGKTYIAIAQNGTEPKFE